jgi:hypothetical protein
VRALQFFIHRLEHEVHPGKGEIFADSPALFQFDPAILEVVERACQCKSIRHGWLAEAELIAEWVREKIRAK